MKILITIIIKAYMFTKIIDLRGKVVTAWADVTQAAISSHLESLEVIVQVSKSNKIASCYAM